MENNNKVARHDNSLTEQEKIEFRNSETWKNFRKQKFEEQNGLDYVTDKPLEVNYNCHHLCMKSNEYTNLVSERFIAVNYETHKIIHKFFNMPNWKETLTSKLTEKNRTRIVRLFYILNQMEVLNDDIEVNLHRNAYNYTLIDSSNKIANAEIAKKLGYPVNEKGYMQWNARYIPEEVPQDTKDWLMYMVDKNSKDETLLLLELRHLNLYSSYRNFRNNPYMSNSVKQQCLKELNETTRLLQLWHKCSHK